MKPRTAVACVLVKSLVAYRIATRLMPALTPSSLRKSAMYFGQIVETGSAISAM